MELEFMDPKDVIFALTPEENILAPALIRGPKLCPACGGAFSILATGTSFCRLRCVACNLEMDPETGFIARVGTPERTVEPNVRMIINPLAGE